MPRYKDKAQWLRELEEIINGSELPFAQFGPMDSWLYRAMRQESEWLADDLQIKAANLIEVIDRTIEADIRNNSTWREVGNLRWLDGDTNAFTMYSWLVKLAKEIGGEDLSMDLYDHLFSDYAALMTAMRRVIRTVYRPMYLPYTQGFSLGDVSVNITPLMMGRGHFELARGKVSINMVGDPCDETGDSLKLSRVYAPSLLAALGLTESVLRGAQKESISA